MNIEISPEPTPEDEQVILAAVEEVRRREQHMARTATWRLSGWVGARRGVRDLSLDDRSRWVLSSRMPWGGRPYEGKLGRGDTK